MTTQTDTLDVAAATAWLRGQGLALTGLPRVERFSGGASNWTWGLTWPEQALVLRRAPSGTKSRAAHDMGREYRIQEALRPQFPWVPRTVAWCPDATVIGAPFSVVERVDGVIPRKELGLTLAYAEARALCTNVLDRLVALHEVDVVACGLSELDKGPGYCRRQIDGWSARYDAARTWNVPRYTRVKAWLSERVPEDAPHVLIHNDFRLDNVVLDAANPTQPRSILDWELATVGDPFMDLGNSLAYWVEAGDDPLTRALRSQPTHLPGMLTREEVWSYYLSRRRLRPPADTAFYEVYGLFRLAGILQQIYYRYHRRESRRRSQRHLWLAVNYLHHRCLRRMRRAAG